MAKPRRFQFRLSDLTVITVVLGAFLGVLGLEALLDLARVVVMLGQFLVVWLIGPLIAILLLVAMSFLYDWIRRRSIPHR